MSMEIIDISLPISPGMAVWPGDPPPELDLVTTLPRDGVQTSRLTLSTHTGTHLDAPRHFLPGGRTIDQLDLGALLGACCVIEIAPEVQRVTQESLRPFTLPPGARVLLKTRNSHRPPAQAFTPDFVALDPSAATYLCEQGIRLVGIDGPSLDAWSASDFPCHRRLLAADILLLENLVLRHVAPGTYRLIALPLNLCGADGSPVRAILLPCNSSPDSAS
jgi:arylformamidase